MTRLVEPVGTEIEVGAGGAFPHSVSLASGNYVVSWLDMVGANDTRVQVFGSDGSPVGTGYSMTAATGYHALAPLTSGGFVIIYTTNSEALAQRFDASGSPAGAEILLGSIDYYSNSNIGAAALSDGGFAASWRNGSTVTVQTYDSSGSPVATLVPDIGEGGIAPQIVQLANGTIALVWHEYDSVSPYSGGYPDGYEVRAQLFSAAGVSLSSEFIVNQSQIGSHSDPKVTALADGGFVVTWVAFGPDADIMAQIYDATGNPVGSNIHISDLTPGWQATPDVAALSWGGFLVTWEDNSPNNPDDFNQGIRAQLLDGTGAPVGETFQVNEQLYGSEVNPSVVIVSDTEARIFYGSTGNADPSGLLGRTIALPTVGTQGDDVLIGAAGNDRIAGLAGNDAINGGEGNDALDGGAGNDRLNGGAGADTLYGGAGDDVYYVDSYGDRVIENTGEGTDSVFASASYKLSANVENLTLTGTADIYGYGNELANVLTGNGGANKLYGLAGNDTLKGGAGVDTMFGGLGNDVYYVDSYTDKAVENAGEGTDSVFSSANFRLGANVERLTLTGSADLWGYGNELANTVVGNAGANRLYGLAGNDTLNGGAGGDWLEGGTGQDRLFGGTGADSFVFRDGDFGGSTAATADQIKDFATGDKIRLNLVDANTGLAGDQAFAFIGTAAFSNVAGQLRYEQISGNTYVSGDTNGDGVADFMIRVDGLHTLVSTDFGL